MRLRYPQILKGLADLQRVPSAVDRKPELKFERNCNFNKAYPRRIGTCRRCRQKVPEGRTYWCSDICNIDAKIRCNPGFADRYLRVRDKGICAKCGTDTKKIPKEKGKRRMWDVNHVLPVYLGGGHCGLDNLETLCKDCHKTTTAEQSKERALIRKSKKESV